MRIQLVLLLLSSGALGAQAPSVPPTGPYPVGTTLVTLVDSTRAALVHPDRSQPRRLTVQLWYPTRATGRGRPAPYVPEFGALGRELESAYPGLGLDALDAHASWQSAPATDRRFPLVVFSHGMNTARFFHTGLLADLASHGFVVAAIDHPFWSFASAADGGALLTLAESMASRDQLSPDQIDGFMQDGVAVMAEDQAFVAARLRTPGSPLAASIDPRHVGVAGHSMGGIAATRACWAYRVFSACASLDGFVWVAEGRSTIGEPPNRVAIPFLLLLGTQFLPDDVAVLVRRYERAWRGPALCVVPGARHNSFSDLPQLRGTAAATGAPSPDTLAVAIRRTVIAFFAETLAGAESVPSPDTRVRPLPGAEHATCP